MPLASVVDGDRMATARLAEPAHAVRESRRAEPYLRIAEPRPELPKHGVARHSNVAELDFGMPPGGGRVDRLDHARELEARRIDVEQKHRGADVRALRVERARHDDVERRAGRTGDHPFATVDHELVAVLS